MSSIVTGIGLTCFFEGEGVKMLNSVEFLTEQPQNSVDGSFTICTKPVYWQLRNEGLGEITSTVTLFYPDGETLAFRIHPPARDEVLARVRELCCIEKFLGTLK